MYIYYCSYSGHCKRSLGAPEISFSRTERQPKDTNLSTSNAVGFHLPTHCYTVNVR